MKAPFLTMAALLAAGIFTLQIPLFADTSAPPNNIPAGTPDPNTSSSSTSGSNSASAPHNTAPSSDARTVAPISPGAASAGSMNGGPTGNYPGTGSSATNATSIPAGQK